MSKKEYHIVPNSTRGGWDIKKSNAHISNIHTDTKADAVKLGRIISQRANSDLIIHGSNNRIQRTDNRGKGLCQPKVKE